MSMHADWILEFFPGYDIASFLSIIMIHFSDIVSIIFENETNLIVVTACDMITYPIQVWDFMSREYTKLFANCTCTRNGCIKVFRSKQSTRDSTTFIITSDKE